MSHSSLRFLIIISIIFSNLIIAESASVITALPAPDKNVASTPYLMANEGGLWMSWQETTSKNKKQLKVAHFADGKWSSPVTVHESKNLMVNWADFPVLQMDLAGTLFVSWLETPPAEKAHGYFIYLARSIDQGKTWNKLGKLHQSSNPNAEHGFVSMLGLKNGVRAFWLDGGSATGHHGKTQLRTALVTDKVRKETVIDDSTCSCCGTSAVMVNDRESIFYRDRSEKEIRDISFLSHTDGHWIAKTPNQDGWVIKGCPVNGPSAANLGNALIYAWFSAANGKSEVKVAFSTNMGQSFTSPVSVTDSNATILGRVQTILLSQSEGLVFWLESDQQGASTLYGRRINSIGEKGRALEIAKMESSRGTGFPKAVLLDETIVLGWTENKHLKMVRLNVSDFPEASAAALIGDGTEQPVFEKIKFFSARDVKDQEVKLSDQKGKKTVLNFWASWCDACVEEIDYIKEIEKKFAEDGIQFIMVNLDDADSWPLAEKIISKTKLQTKIWKSTPEASMGFFGFSALPHTVFIDSKLKIESAISGSLLSKKDILKKNLQQLSKKPQ